MFKNKTMKNKSQQSAWEKEAVSSQQQEMYVHMYVCMYVLTYVSWGQMVESIQ